MQTPFEPKSLIWEDSLEFLNSCLFLPSVGIINMPHCTRDEAQNFKSTRQALYKLSDIFISMSFWNSFYITNSEETDTTAKTLISDI